MFKTGGVHLVMGGVRRARCRDVHAAGTTLTPIPCPGENGTGFSLVNRSWRQYGGV